MTTPSYTTPWDTISEPDDSVWLLRCSNATYRVRLIPDMRATIERIE